MQKHAIVPDGLRDYRDDWKMSPGLRVGNLIFMTGCTASRPDGTVPADAETQMRDAFDKVGAILREAGLGFDALVEMTTYHVGLADHLAMFRKVREDYVQEPYPAWTAIEVSGFATPGLIVEIRCIAAV
jgi:enamine deaminase RidA (YjgF/YER057c/UK114 family)